MKKKANDKPQNCYTLQLKFEPEQVSFNAETGQVFITMEAVELTDNFQRGLDKLLENEFPFAVSNDLKEMHWSMTDALAKSVAIMKLEEHVQ